MLSYFTIPSSTAIVVQTFNFVVEEWGDAQMIQLFLLIMGMLFAIVVFTLIYRYVFHK